MDLASKLQMKPGQCIEVVLVPESVTSELSEIAFDGNETAALLVFVAERSTLEVA